MGFLRMLLLLLLGCLAVGCQANAITNSSLGIDSAELVFNPCQEKRLAGFVCVDCVTLGFCSHVDGQWLTVSMTECQTERGFYCSDEDTIGCTWQPKCQVPVRGKFYCQLPGVFPDPYDCRSYHDCSAQNEDTPRQCTNGAAYSLLTHTCSLPRESEQCTEKQYSCSYLGETGAWAANSSYYYICNKDRQGDQDVFYPLMMKCSDGYTFDGSICSANKPRLTKPPQQRTTCQEGMQYPAETKYGFNLCLNGALIYQKCPVDYYFDQNRKACVMEKEETCEEYRLYAAETEHGYLLCLNGELTYNACPEGSVFNGNNAVCSPVHQ